MRCNPWRWLWGLIPVAILTFLTVQWEHDRIEADLAKRTETALQAAGQQWAVAAFDGRDGLITGQANSDEGPPRALAVVRDVWGVRISDQRTHLLPMMQPYQWSAGLRGDRLKLIGYVPSNEARTNIIGLAKAAFPNLSVDDRLELARGVPDRDVWLGAIGFGLKQLASLSNGTLSLTDVGLRIEGEAENLAEYKSVKGALKTKMPAGVTLVAEKITPPVISPFTWTARRQANQIQLGGYVPDEALREQIFTHAKKLFPRHAIVDRMETGAGAPDMLAAVAKAALEQLAKLDNGVVELSGTKLRITGQAPDQASATAAVTGLSSAAKGYQISNAITYPKPPPAPVSPYVLKFDYTGSNVSVAGYVPNDEARAELLAAARKRFPDIEVRDQLQLASGEPPLWLSCVKAGLSKLGDLDRGAFTITDTKLMLVGSTRSEAVASNIAGELRTAANRACETSVDVAFDAPPEPNLNWRAEHDGGKTVVIEGDVLDARTRAALVQAATRYFPDAQIQDRMTIKNASSAKWAVAAELGLKLIAILRRGEAVVSGQNLLVRGEAKDTAVQTGVRDQLSRGIPKGYTARDAVEVRSDAMIWAEQEAKRKAAEDAAKSKANAEKEARLKQDEQSPPSPEKVQRREEASACQRIMREVATTGVIRFDWASDNLDNASRPTLDKLAKIARACPQAKIEIEGHTDAEGTPERNKNLSERRAKAVYDYLSKAGIDAVRLSAVGYGETKPVAPNDTPVNRAKNRRIEFTVTPE